MDITDSVNSRSLHISAIEEKLNNWTIPKVASKKIYETGYGFTNLFLQDYVIETTEKSLPVNPEVEQIELIDNNKMKRLKEKYRFMHLGLVQVAVKPLHKKGLNAPIIMCLRDARLLSFSDSILAVFESNLTNGPVYFNCYPNFSVDLFDANLSKTLTLQMKIPPSMIMESNNVIIIYRIHYKLMKTHLSPRAKIESGRDTTVLIEANYEHANIHTPRLLQWDQVTFPDTWKIPHAAPPRMIKPRTQPIEIIEEASGAVEIVFKKRDPGETSQRITSSVKSTSSRHPTFKGVDWLKNIPKAQYEVETPGTSVGRQSESPPMSPTPSELITPSSHDFRNQI